MLIAPKTLNRLPKICCASTSTDPNPHVRSPATCQIANRPLKRACPLLSRPWTTTNVRGRASEKSLAIEFCTTCSPFGSQVCFSFWFTYRSHLQFCFSTFTSNFQSTEPDNRKYSPISNLCLNRKSSQNQPFFLIVTSFLFYLLCLTVKDVESL